MISGEGSPGSSGADQSVQDMAASWQSLIDHANQRRQAAGPTASTPERRGNSWSIRNPFRHNPRTGVSASPEPAQERQENLFQGIFQGAISILRDRIPGLRPNEAVSGYLTEQFRQKASRVPTFGGHSLWDMVTYPVRHPISTGKAIGKGAWESKTEIAAGAAVGAITKEAAKWAFNLILAEPGTLLARAGVGALAGAATASAKEYYRGLTGYSRFKKELDVRLQQALTASEPQIAGRPRLNDQITAQDGVRMKALGKEYQDLEQQLATEADSRKREALGDQMRYLRFFIKKQDWQRNSRSVNPEYAINQFLRDSQTDFGAQTDRVRKELLGAYRVDKGRLGKRALRGAAFGAAGAIAGGLLVDFIHGHFEAAGSAVPGASATEPTSTPRPAVFAQTQPFETATHEPATSTPAPAPTETPPRSTATATVEPPKPAVAPPAEAPKAPVTPETLPPTTTPSGAEVSGSVADNNLTYDGKPWVLMDNGVKNIDNLIKTAGEAGDIDKQALAANLQNATKLWANGQLNYTDQPDLYRIFHLSNGTASVYNDLLGNDTLESLKKLGIVKK